MIVPGDFEWESGRARAAELCRRDRAGLPTAVVCGSDMVALGAMQGFQESGLRVPEDISMVGFDDIAEAATSSPPLTTMHQSLQEQGRQGIEMLLGRIQGTLRRGHLRRILPTEMVLRASVGPPRSSLGNARMVFRKKVNR